MTTTSWYPKTKVAFSLSFGFPSFYFGYTYGYPVYSCLNWWWWYPFSCVNYYYPSCGYVPFWCPPWYVHKPVYFCDYYDPHYVVTKEVHHVVHVEKPEGETLRKYEAPEGDTLQDKNVLSAEELKKLTPAEQYERLGDLFFRRGQYDEAASAYEKAIRENPERAALQFILADARFAMGDYHGAALAIRRGLEREPGLAGAKADKRSFYASEEEFDRQLGRLRQFVAEHSADADALLVLGYNLHFSGQREEARKAFERVKETNRGDAAAEAFLGTESK